MSRLDLPEAADKPAFVRAMFDRIAPGYEKVNRWISLGRDAAWRRAALDAVALVPGERVVDLATGTGDFARLAHALGARVVGIDFSAGMLRAGHASAPGLARVQADAVRLPLPDSCVTLLTCGFALRNFADLDAVFSECARVLAPGGRLAIIEVDEPRSRLLRLGHGVHFRKVVPAIGAWLSDAPAYRYLPASTTYLPPEAELLARIAAAGFDEIVKTPRMLGAVQQLTARRC